MERPTSAFSPRHATPCAQAVDNRTVFIIPAFDVRGKHEKAAWADALVSSSKVLFFGAVCWGERGWGNG